MAISNIVVAYLCFLALYWIFSGIVGYLLFIFALALTKTRREGVFRLSFWKFCAGGGLSLVVFFMWYPVMSFRDFER